MGAWIETAEKSRLSSVGIVAPCVGAWIETAMVQGLVDTARVAPCVGAWIETADGIVYVPIDECRSLRGSVD